MRMRLKYHTIILLVAFVALLWLVYILKEVKPLFPAEKKTVKKNRYHAISGTIDGKLVTYRNGSAALHNLPYIHKNGRLCQTKQRLLYFVYVFTEPHHFLERDRIRKTWGSQKLFNKPLGRLAFMLGRSKDSDVQVKIEKECNTFGDIVQEDFVESYYNLTFKGVMSFRWISENCKNVDFIVKVDDDHFLNLFRAIEIMETSGRNAKRTFFCVPFSVNTSKVIRERGKYYVDPRQLSDPFFPPYCSGPTWIATRDVIDDLYKASFQVPYVPIEDAYSTGVLAREAGNVHRIYEGGGGFQTPEVYRKLNSTPPLFGTINTSEYFNLWFYLIENAKPDFQHLLNLQYKKIFKQKYVTKLKPTNRTKVQIR